MSSKRASSLSSVGSKVTRPPPKPVGRAKPDKAAKFSESIVPDFRDERTAKRGRSKSGAAAPVVRSRAVEAKSGLVRPSAQPKLEAHKKDERRAAPTAVSKATASVPSGKGGGAKASGTKAKEPKAIGSKAIATKPIGTKVGSSARAGHQDVSKQASIMVRSNIVVSDASGAYRPSDAEPFMNERQREYFRNKLVAWKEEILRQNRETLAGMHQDSLQYPDITDRATSETDRATELRTRDRERKLVAKIDAALARIEDGSYGYCEETGEPIGLRRLDARPIATLTVEAQERHERAERVHREEN